jgi:hypothetical protein
MKNFLSTSGYIILVACATTSAFVSSPHQQKEISLPNLKAATTADVSNIAAAAAANSNAADQDGTFPPPLSSVDRLKRAATFWTAAIPIVANYYGLIGNIKLQELLGKELSETDIEVST